MTSTSQPQTTTTFSKGYLISLSATLFWSFTGIIISYLSRTYALPSLVLAFWRDLSVAIALGLLFLTISPSRFRLARPLWGFMLLYGMTLALFNSMWTFSVEFNGASVATVLAFSSPAMTAVLERWIFKEPINRLKLTSILLAILGTILVSGAHQLSAWRVNAAGITFGLLTGFFFACYNMFGKSASNKSIDSWTTQVFIFSFATVFLLLFNVVTDASAGKSPLGNLFWLGNSFDGWFWLIFLGIGPTLGGFGLYTMSLGLLPATVANLIATLEPVLTAIWAYFLFNERLSSVQLVGSLLIFAGVVLLRLRRAKK